MADTGAVVMIHFLAGTPADERRWLLSRLDRLAPSEKRRVIELTEVDGEPVLITRFIFDFISLRAWLETAADVPPSATTTPASESKPAPGEFTQLFRGLTKPEDRPSEKSDAPEPAIPDGMGFTGLFKATPQPPAEGASPPPATPPPPPLPDYRSDTRPEETQSPKSPDPGRRQEEAGENYLDRLRGGSTPPPSVPDSPPPPPTPPPAAQTPDGVQELPSYLRPGAEGERPPEPPPPSGPSDFTRIISAASPPPQQAPPEAVAPEPSSAPASESHSASAGSRSPVVFLIGVAIALLAALALVVYFALRPADSPADGEAPVADSTSVAEAQAPAAPASPQISDRLPVAG